MFSINILKLLNYLLTYNFLFTFLIFNELNQKILKNPKFFKLKLNYIIPINIIFNCIYNI